MKYNKKKIFCITSLGAVIIICIIYILLLLYTQKCQEKASNLLKFYYDEKDETLSFSVDDGYKFHHIYSQNGNLSVPYYDSDTRNIYISIRELPVGKNDFLYFTIQDLKNTESYYFEYEILHQDDKCFMIELFDYPFANGLPETYYFTSSFTDKTSGEY